MWLLKSTPDAVAVVAGNDGRVDFVYDPGTLVYVQTVASATPSEQRGYMALAASLMGYYAVQYGNIYGFVASTSFKDITDEEAQKMVWNKLKEKLEINQY